MKTTLALTKPNPLAVIHPPPTKREILEGMVQIRIEQRKKQIAEREAEVKRLTAEAEELVTAWLLRNFRTVTPNIRLGSAVETYVEGRGYVKSDRCTNVYAFIELDKALPPNLHAKLAKIDALKCQRIPVDAETIRRELRHGFTGTPEERVTALLGSKTARAAMEQMLEKIGA